MASEHIDTGCDDDRLPGSAEQWREAVLQRVIDLANACVEQGLPLTAMIPMLEDMR